MGEEYEKKIEGAKEDDVGIGLAREGKEAVGVGDAIGDEDAVKMEKAEDE